MKIVLVCLMFFLVNGFAAAQETLPADTPEAPLAGDYKKWIDQDVAAIISDFERNAYLGLKTDADRQKFIDGFWEDRDPTPGTKRNEFREDYDERMKYVMENFNRESSMPPWKTERGKTYLALGKPQFRKRFPEEAEFNPMELWQYRAVRDYGLPESFYVVFFQKNGFGPYRIYSPASDGPESLVKYVPSLDPANQPRSGKKNQKPTSFTTNVYYEALEKLDPEMASASFSLLPTEGAYTGGVSGTAVVTSEIILGKLENARNYHFEKREYVDRILKGRPKVEVYYSLGPQDVKSDIYWFQAPNGYFLVDFAVQFAPEKFQMGQYNDEVYTSLTFDGNIQTAKDNIMVESVNSSHEIKLNKTQFEQARYSPFQYQGRRLIVPGNFKISILVKNNLSKSVVPIVEDLKIPDFDTATAPYFSKLLFVQSTEHVSAEGRGTKPFQFGETVFQPLVEHKYPPGSTASFFYQLFFPGKSLPLHSEDLTLEYEAFQQDASVAKLSVPLIEKQPKIEEGSISILDNLSLKGVNFGPARIVVRLKQGDRVLCESEPGVITIEAGKQATPWRLVSGIPNLNSPFHKYVLAQQYIRLKQTDKASAMLQEVTDETPSNLEARIELMKLALKNKQYDRVLELAHDIEIQYPKNKDLLWVMGWSYYGKNQYEEAVRFFERGRLEEPGNIQLLNVLADVYQRLEKYDKSLEMIQKSLALNPKQPDMIQMRDKLQSDQTNNQ